jgi:predicted cupin superfamily sugar epimerase
MSNDEVTVKEITLDREVKNGHFLHYVVKAGIWFYMESKGEYSLIGCAVAPPFDFKDFELAPKDWSPGKK